MFKDIQNIPGLAEVLKSEGIVIAHNITELEDSPWPLKASAGIVLIRAGEDLNRLLQLWWAKPMVNWSALEGKSVLDLASGSALNKEKRLSGHIWYPHFARLCAVNGADVTVVDKYLQGEIDRELITEVQIDLVEYVIHDELSNHPALRNRTFDIIHSANFIGPRADPGLANAIRSNTGGMPQRAFEMLMLKQCVPLLAPGGILDLDTVDKSGAIEYFIKRQ